jgi:hypothetical protein
MNESKHGACAIISIVLTVLNGVGLIAFTVGFLACRPKCEQMYADFGAPLPTMTYTLFAVPSAVVVLLSLLLLGALVGKEFIRHKALPLVLNCIWIVLAITLSMLVSLALMAPVAMEQM